MLFNHHVGQSEYLLMLLYVIVTLKSSDAIEAVGIYRILQLNELSSTLTAFYVNGTIRTSRHELAYDSLLISRVKNLWVNKISELDTSLM